VGYAVQPNGYLDEVTSFDIPYSSPQGLTPASVVGYCNMKTKEACEDDAPPYFGKYKNIAFSRDEDGVLLMRFHTDGGPIVFTGQTHQDLPEVLEEIALDRQNKALVLTGTGDSFMDPCER
jgi:hypothetical protein